MNASDPIGALVRKRTGRTLDQHALDRHPAAAELPRIAELARTIRRELMLAINDMARLFADGGDADPHRIPETLLDPVIDSVVLFTAQYLDSRALLDILLVDLTRRRLSSAAPQPVRRYLREGDIVNVTVPYTPTCISGSIAGCTMRVTVTATGAVTDPVLGPVRLHLAHHDAGIYRDPANGRLYTLDHAAA
ncbi:hypothetical protein Rhe02_09740 [Rhizocola hellebori]|uniref:Uncharacterized protein n=1 Tax=Rhizocola hellebori TaxID=1392758 RepID=A0A8J3VE16_9ACTN|nr:hypothetical protein [Rhizocola hellebori]GIH02907.1 hypothetical protein Rhe02_09740 [Rhizocola hellebori]